MDNKNVNWINYIYYNLKQLGRQLHETSVMAMQNRQALDWILAERGGVCKLFGTLCCTVISNYTSADGAFSIAMSKLEALKVEMAGNAGKGGSIKLDELEEIFGKWGAALAKIGVSALVVLIMLFLLTCCIVPILKKWYVRAMDKKLDFVMDIQGAQMHINKYVDPRQLVRRILLAQREDTPDLFPIPDYLDDKYSSEAEGAV